MKLTRKKEMAYDVKQVFVAKTACSFGMFPFIPTSCSMDILTIPEFWLNKINAKREKQIRINERCYEILFIILCIYD
jgi:hypothetical protein